MTDDMKRLGGTGPGGGKNDAPTEDPFHNVILFPSRRKEPNDQKPPPPSAA